MDVFKKRERHGRQQKNNPLKLEHERWVWNALAVESRYHLVSYVGKRELESAKRTLRAIKKLTPDSAPIFITDGLKVYQKAILTAYARSGSPFSAKILRENFGPNDLAGFTLTVPADLTHLRVIKQPSQVDGKFTQFPTFRSTLAGKTVELATLVKQIPTLTRHTNYVERRNFTQRRRCAGLQRKTSSIPQTAPDLQAQLTLERFVSNFCRPHRSLRVFKPKPDSRKQWQPVTPAMKLGVSQHIWSLADALTLVPRSLSKRTKRVRDFASEVLPEPSLVTIGLKDSKDLKILKGLTKDPLHLATRSELVQLTRWPRTTIYDRLKVLEAKAVLKRVKIKRSSLGRPKIGYLCLWQHYSFVQRTNCAPYVLVS